MKTLYEYIMEAYELPHTKAPQKINVELFKTENGREQIISYLSSTIEYLARKLSETTGMSYDDLVGDGVEGALIALDNFDYKKSDEYGDIPFP